MAFEIGVEGTSEVPQNVIQAVRQLAESGRMVERSFPNGSCYKRWVIPLNRPVQIGEAVATLCYDAGIVAEDPTRWYRVEKEEVLGPGADFGIYFCTRDQIGLVLKVSAGSPK